MESSVRSRALIHFPSAEPHEPPQQQAARVVPFTPSAHVEEPQGVAELSVRVAVYSPRSALPEVYDLSASDPGALLAEACRCSVQWVRERGSRVPVEAVVAVVENLIHAHFRLAAVSIAADGSVTVSDQGPGIPDKQRALLPGFTTATAEMRRYIRGVGSGLTVASQLMERIGGELRIEDNLAGGTVVTLSPRKPSPFPAAGPAPGPSGATNPPSSPGSPATPLPPLTARQRRLLLLTADMGEVGPSSASQRLGLSLTTAFRELVVLESLGLVVPDGAGKRRLTPKGLAAVEHVLREEMSESLRRTTA